MISAGTPSGYSSLTCGYCSPSGSRSEQSTFRNCAGLYALQLGCQVYQQMIDRGWRRSGVDCYKPDLKRSCCPLYTIKLDALAFRPSKSQRKLLNRWNRFVLCGASDDGMQVDEAKPTKAVKGVEFVWPSVIHAAEQGFFADESPHHKFEVMLEPSSYTEEKYSLFARYQVAIHDDHQSSPSGFRRFLVRSPLKLEEIPYPSPPPADLPKHYGSYHQLYRLDGKLIAMSIIDILPSCVSSVYFIYDNDWERFSFGKLSVLREAALAHEIHNAGVPSMQSLYLGFYVHACQKMRYKGEYHPSYLADPVTYEWYPLKDCQKSLDTHRYACFSYPESSLSDKAPSDEELEIPDPPLSPALEIGSVNIIDSIEDGQVSVSRQKASRAWLANPSYRELLFCIDGLGVETSKEMMFYM